MPTILPLSDFQINPTAYRFEGGTSGDVAVSFFLVHTKPGQGASLHSHPYAEVFLVQEGKVAFVMGSETVNVNDDNVVIVPAQTPHKFTNVGTTHCACAASIRPKRSSKPVLKRKGKEGITPIRRCGLTSHLIRD